MKPPKFIIYNDPELGLCLIIARVDYHKELTDNLENIKGGGYWRRGDDKEFILSGTSEDFGRATIEDITEAVNKGNIFTNKYCVTPMTKYGISYDNSSEIIKIK